MPSGYIASDGFPANGLPGINGGPPVSLPGNVSAEGTSLYAIGNVVASLPDGFTFPDNTSAIAWPPSCPGCQPSRIASTLSRQLASSIGPPTFRTAINRLSLDRNALLSRSI